MKPELPKCLIVTGGASGIGYAFSEHLAQLGHRVVIADLRGAEEAAARLRESGHQAIVLRTDVVSEADVADMTAAAVSEFGGIDGLVAALAEGRRLQPACCSVRFRGRTPRSRSSTGQMPLF